MLGTLMGMSDPIRKLFNHESGLDTDQSGWKSPTTLNRGVGRLPVPSLTCLVKLLGFHGGVGVSEEVWGLLRQWVGEGLGEGFSWSPRNISSLHDHFNISMSPASPGHAC